MRDSRRNARDASHSTDEKRGKAAFHKLARKVGPYVKELWLDLLWFAGQSPEHDPDKRGENSID